MHGCTGVLTVASFIQLLNGMLMVRWQTHVISMEVGNEDLVQLAWPEAAPHQLHLAALTTVKHPATHLCSPCKSMGDRDMQCK